MTISRKPRQPSEAELAQMEREQVLSTINYNLGQQLPFILPVFDQLQSSITAAMIAQGFWDSANTGEKIALMHSELSEMLEADRKSIDTSEHIPDFSGVEEELADLIIRALDFAGYHQLRLGEALLTKMTFNLNRPFKHGKKY
jgi:NTP pyrophosphatase (non-canonical NTP hydrolase)